MDHKTMRNKKSNTFRDMYTEMPVDVSYELYKRILDSMCKTIKNRILNASECFKMPCGLGTVQVVKYRPKSFNERSLNVDYKSSKEYNKKIYHLNEHSDGYTYRLYWSKVPMTFTDRYKYSLSLVRKLKRELAQLIFNKKDYININDIQFYKV